MGTFEDLTEGIEYLQERRLFTHNQVTIVKSIPPGEINPAVSWLMWASFECEPVIEPPTFAAAYISRVTNIQDVFYLEPRGSVTRELIKSRRPTWETAIGRGNIIRARELELARVVIGQYVTSYPEIK